MASVKVEGVVIVAKFLSVDSEALSRRGVPHITVACGEIERDVVIQLGRNPHQL